MSTFSIGARVARLPCYGVPLLREDAEYAGPADAQVTGDLVRAHSGGKLCILPDSKLQDLDAAIDSVKKLADIEGIEAILTGDGWPIFRDGKAVMSELVATLCSQSSESA